MTNAGDGSVSKIDPEQATGGRQADPDRPAAEQLAVGHGSVWVTDPSTGTVTRIGPRSMQASGDPIEVGDRPTRGGDGRRLRVGRERRRLDGQQDRSEGRGGGRPADPGRTGPRRCRRRQGRRMDGELRRLDGDPDQAVGPAAPGRAGETTPLRSASSARRTRFLFCGRSPTSNLSNRARRFAFTASTLRKTSSAICCWSPGSRTRCRRRRAGRAPPAPGAGSR